ncbi:MAG: MATE family efflux transporter [Alphaproteobacteria bacterium]
MSIDAQGLRDGPTARKRLWRLAGPIMIANLSVPLMGLVDTAVMGHLPDPAYVGAVAVGAVIFAYVFWGFGFLRMSTTGLAAQAGGRNDPLETQAVYYRGILLAIVLAASVIALQVPIAALAFSLLEAEAPVEAMAKTYFTIRIWSAPAALASYVIIGWFLGQEDARTPLLLQVLTAGLNIVFSLTFVVGFGWGVEGVAGATLLAEVSGAVLGAILVQRRLKRLADVSIDRSLIFDLVKIKALIGVNGDIFIRTLCLVTSFAIFTAEGAKFGTVILAANAVLMHFMEFASYGMDGFAHAAEALVGRAAGRRDRKEFQSAVKTALLWSGLLSLAIAIVYFLAGNTLIAFITTQEPIRSAAADYLPWAAAMPVISFWCFILDGVFLGATRSKALRNAMLVSTGVYVVLVYGFVSGTDNHALWAALVVFMGLRGLTLAAAYPALLRSVGDASPRDQRLPGTTS